MRKVWVGLRHSATVSLLAFLTACGGGGGNGGEGATASTAGENSTSGQMPIGEAPNADPAPTNHPSGLYWSWGYDMVPFTNPATGFTQYYRVFKYTHVKYFDNGLVYIGPPTPDFDKLTCVARSQDADGNGLCVPYAVSNSQISIDGESAVPLQQSTDGWTIDGYLHRPLLPLHDFKLDGSYTSRTCYRVLCTRATFVFRPDGTFTASRSNTYANTIGDSFVGGGGGAADQVGTYRIEGHAITMTLPGAPGGRMFFFIDGDSIQIAEDRFAKD